MGLAVRLHTDAQGRVLKVELPEKGQAIRDRFQRLIAARDKAREAEGAPPTEPPPFALDEEMEKLMAPAPGPGSGLSGRRGR